ncbi:MAG: hypothetical protein IPL83_10420 [Bdellovibrionales bacterium]|nr:hypothetical protein [Bdellovibrionales bacterium]
MENVKSDKILGVITGILFLSGILTITWTVYATWLIKRQSVYPPNLKCIYTTKNDTMGTSELGHILTKGQTYKVLMGYYRCNEVSRGDLVLYQFSDEILPVIRIVRGIPNDQIETREVSTGLWEIRVNSNPIPGPDGGDFQLTELASPPLLNTLMKSRNGILKNDEYLLMTLLPPGSDDSLRLGPAPKSRLRGKVLARQRMMSQNK